MKLGTIRGEKFTRKGILGNYLLIDPNIDLQHIRISVPVSKRKSLRSNRTYYIIKGTAEFTIGSKKYTVKATEAIHIPKNTIYSYKPLDKIELVEINKPTYKSEYEMIFEDN